MANITLTVDYKFNTDLNDSVTQLINSINANPPKIKLDFDTSQAKKTLNGIFDSTKTGSKIKMPSIDTSQATKTASSTGKVIQQEFKQIVDAGLKVQNTLNNISSLKLNASGIKGADSIATELETCAKNVGLLRTNFEQGKISYDKFNTGLNNVKTTVLELKGTLKSLADEQKTTAEATAKKAKTEKDYQTVLEKGKSALKEYLNAENSTVKSSRDAYAAIKEQINTLQTLYDEYQGIDPNSDESKEKLNELATAVKNTSNAISSNTGVIKNNDNALQKWRNSTSGIISSLKGYALAALSLQKAIEVIKKMASTVIDIDSAMTELKKVTDETDETYSIFLEDAATRATKVGATLSDVISATTEFARLGYGINEASGIGDAAIIYKNVGDGIESVSDAAESIISTMQAFSDEATSTSADFAMSIVDKFNEVGNNFAISSEGIGEVLQRSASALSAAGNTLDESIGMAAATNTVIQNPESVGTFLKTYSMYLRAAKTEAEDAGISTDGMASSVSELRDEVLKLTGNKVDIQIDENTFKSTYQISEELSAIWDSLSDISQANLTELLVGKRNGNAFSALLKNFDIAKSAMASSYLAEGSAIKENEKILDSVQGKITELKSTFEVLSSTVVDSDMLKFFIELATNILKAANTVAKLVQSVGGLKTVITTIVAYNLLKKFNSLYDIFDKAKEKFKAFKTSVGDIVEGLTSVNDGVTSGVKGFLTGGLSLTLTAVSAALGAVIVGYTQYRAAIEKQRQAAYDAAEQSQEEVTNLLDLYEAYKNAETAYNNNTGSKADLTTATNDLITAMGIEQTTVESLTTAYGSLDAAVQSVMANKLSQNATNAITAWIAAKDEVEEAFGVGSDIISNFLNGSGSYSIIPTYDLTQDEIAIVRQALSSLNLPEDFERNVFFEDNDFDGVDDFVQFNFDTSTIENAQESYRQLLAYEQEFLNSVHGEGEVYKGVGITAEDLQNSVIYKQISTAKTYFEESLGPYLEMVEKLNQSQVDWALFKELDSGNIPKTTKELSDFKDKIAEAVVAGGYFQGSTEDAMSYIDYTLNLPEYQMFFEGLAEVVEAAAEETTAAAEATADEVSDATSSISSDLKQTVDEASKSVSSLTEQFTKLQEVLSNQKVGNSISYEDFNSDELKDYQDALEYVNGTMQLNAEESRKIAKAKAEEQIAQNNANKAYEQSKYLENAKQIQQLREQIKSLSDADDDARNTIQSSIDALREENNEIVKNCNNYDLLSASLREATSAYSNWINAQSSSDYGDYAEDTASAVQLINDTFDPNSDIYGQIGSKKFDAAIEFIVPDSVDSEDIDAIQSYMDSFTEYLDFDEDGNMLGLDMDRFAENAVKAGLMSYSEDDGFKVLGGKKMEDFAEGMNLSMGVVQAMFDKLQLYGGDFDWSDEQIKTLGDLSIAAYEAYEELEKLGSFDDQSYAINLDISSKETKDGALRRIEKNLDELNLLKAKVDVDTDEIEYANQIIQYLIVQKQLLNEPIIMSVDTSQVEGQSGEVLALLQQFQEAKNNLEIQAAIGADTSAAQADIDAVVEKIQSLPSEVKTTLNIDDTSAETIQQTIDNITLNDLTAKFNVDDTAIAEYEPEEKDATVIYEADTSRLPKAFSDIGRKVNYWANLKNLPTSLPVLTRQVVYYTTYRSSGSSSSSSSNSKVSGTAHASGTAKLNGDWGTASGGKTLVGELGEIYARLYRNIYVYSIELLEHPKTTQTTT